MHDVLVYETYDLPGLVKTHFYHIWVQNKVLREKHELRKLHEMLNEVRVLIPTIAR